MAEKLPRMIVFHGTEKQRRYWIEQKNLDPHFVVLAINALRHLQGWCGPVDTWIASGDDGLDRESSLRLAQQIRLLNNLYGKDPTQ